QDSSGHGVGDSSHEWDDRLQSYKIKTEVQRSDTLPDYSRWFSLQRLLRRTITRLFDRREICNGNRESLRGFFSRDAIIVWHFKSFKRKRRRIRQWRDDPAAPPVTRLTSSRQAEKWLDGLREGALDC
ncbi:MAG: hypothetical protein ACRDSN_07190, partial [Pseudonocardiaceae bacterium]